MQVSYPKPFSSADKYNKWSDEVLNEKLSFGTYSHEARYKSNLQEERTQAGECGFWLSYKFPKMSDIHVRSPVQNRLTKKLMRNSDCKWLNSVLQHTATEKI